MTLSIQAKHYINAKQPIPYYNLSVEEARAQRAQLPLHTIEFDTIIKKTITIPTRDRSTIQIRIFAPKTTEKKPVILYFHGGGWVFGSIDTFDATTTLLAKHSDAIVVSVNYRLAPEFPFPTPVYDAIDAYKWLIENITTLNGDLQKIVVSGDSAGGNLAAALTSYVSTTQKNYIAQQVLIYPVLQFDFSTNSYEKYGTNFGLDREGMAWFKAQYVSDKQLNDPLVSPKLFINKELLPPTLLIAAQYDVLNDEGVDYIYELQKNHVQAERIEMRGLIHSYFGSASIFEDDIIDTATKIKDFIYSYKS